MKKELTLVAMTVLFAANPAPGLAQDTKKTEGTEAKPKETAGSAEKPKTAPLTQEALEAQFKTTLTKAVLAGRWTSTKDGKLGPEKEDKYTIVGVTKVSGDQWVVNSRIQYGKMDVVMPVPVQVKWAGDTAVIIVNKLSMGGPNSYNARVLVYDNTYAGTWSSSSGHGGLMSGLITHEGEAAAPPTPSAATPEAGSAQPK